MAIEIMKDALVQQLGAAIDSLEGTIRAFPEDRWTEGERWFQPWYLAFHALFWLDLYLSESSFDYHPPAPFSRGELEPGVYPDRPYEKEELLDWVRQCRLHLDKRLATVSSEEEAARTCHLHWGQMRAVELLLYNLRHVQHHVGQLNLMIRQVGGEPAPWIMRTDGLDGAE